MPTKTDRILSYLPGTFRALPKPTALFSVADAFGNELLQAENSLAAVMLAHWVDHADRGAEFIDDLARMASLYGLAPRDDESVEEFREHLKRYVRTFLDGTVTVQGVLRIVSEALGLHIADEYAQMDTWWTRTTDELTTVERRGDDAAKLLFGVEAAIVTGQAAQSARRVGTVDLSGGVDLRGASLLRIRLNAAAPVDVELAPQGSDPAAVQLDDIISRINAVLGASVASRNGNFLALTSPIVGPNSRLEVQENERDAAPRALGLRPLTYHGAAAAAAQVISAVDFRSGVDLTDVRYIRLFIDREHLAEIDCAAGLTDLKHVQLTDITKAINAALGVTVASHDGHFLKLASPKIGFGSSIAFEPPAAQDATTRLFGPVPAFHTGRDASPADVTGIQDLSQGMDLSGPSKVRLRVDARPPITVDCVGADPKDTRLSEIVAALNEALGPGVASHDGRFVRLTSPTNGPASTIAFEPLPPGEDAAELIFGIAPRTSQGGAATRARFVGAPDLSAGINLGALHTIQVALDGGSPIEVDVRAAASDSRAAVSDSRAAKPDDIAKAINVRLGPDIASTDGQHLILASPTTGSASHVEMIPLETERHRRFVTRAFITDEATQAIFGFISREAEGTAPSGARVVGTIDLSRGVDVREKRLLRIGVDGAPAREVDFAAAPTHIPRPRVAMLDEIVKAINAALPTIASDDGQHLILTSPSAGASSRITFEASQALDALNALLGIEPQTFRGRSATGVSFVGTADLSAGVDLPANAALALRIDEQTAPVQIALTESEAAHKSLTEIVVAINVAFQADVARTDGTHIRLNSPSTGKDSQIEFGVPNSGVDATKSVFGITAPRRYQGADATKAQIVGVKELQDGADLHIGHFLRLVVEGRQVDVDCAAGIADPKQVKLSAIEAAIKASNVGVVASDDGAHLILTSTTVGAAARLELLRYTDPDADARAALLGDATDAQGSDPLPAIITGEADLLAPVNLAERRLIRLAVDHGRAVDIDVAGAAPDSTTLDELAAKINAIFPRVASATDDDRLRLTSPRAGDDSHLQVLPLRTLEVIEYPPSLTTDPLPEQPPRPVRHGDGWFVDNAGAADADLTIELSAPQGAVGPAFVNRTINQRIRLNVALQPGETLMLSSHPQTGLSAETIAADGARTPVEGKLILVGPLGAQAVVPFEGEWRLSGGDVENAAALQLNNPLAPSIVLLRARESGAGGDRIEVTVVEATLTGVVNPPIQANGQPARWVGRVRADAEGYWLVDGAETKVAHLRAGSGIALENYRDQVVAVHGPLHPADGATVLMIVESIAKLFDVTLSDGVTTETYGGVTIGLAEGAFDSLTNQIYTKPSQLALALAFEKRAALQLPRGRSEWAYLDCFGARFDRDRFDQACFAGGLCTERGVFDISRFTRTRTEIECTPREMEVAVFALAGPLTDPPVEVRFHWTQHLPGAFVVNLPADLPEEFGGRFDLARFALPNAEAEEYKGVVTEPRDDQDHLVRRITAKKSNLVKADMVDRPPIGFEPVTMPFRHPRIHTLTGGRNGEAAQLYLAEEGVPGFIQLLSKESGEWGNNIAVTARKAGPARFDVTISYRGGRFENARQVALAGHISKPGEEPLPALIEDLLKPGPVGVLQTKAAGICVDVTRDRADSIL